MAYTTEKIGLFTVQPANAGKKSVSISSQNMTANRGNYAAKNDNFSNHLEQAASKADKNYQKDNVQSQSKEAKADYKDGNTVKDNSTVKNTEDTAKTANVDKDTTAEAANTDTTAATVQNEDISEPEKTMTGEEVLYQFLNYTGNIDALLGMQQLQEGQPLAIQAGLQPAVLAEIAKQLGNVDSANAQQLLQAAANALQEGRIELPQGMQPVAEELELQPAAMEALLGNSAEAEANQSMLNILSSNNAMSQSTMQQISQQGLPTEQIKQALQDLAQGTAVTANETTAQSAVQAQAVNAEALKSNISNNSEAVDTEAVNTLSNMLEGAKVTVESQQTGNNANSQHGFNQQMNQQMTQQPVNADGEVQPMQMPGQAAFDVAPVEVKELGQNNTIGAGNFQQVLNAADGMEEAQQVQQPQQSNTDYEIPKQIVEQARLIRTAENTEMVIKLNPRHLGDLTLKVAVNGNGGVTATFHSDNSTVRGIIETSMVQLKNDLAEQGIKVDKVEVSAQLPDQQMPDNMGQGYNAQQGSQSGKAAKNDVADYEEGEAVENVQSAETVDGVPVNNSAEPIRDALGNVISDGVDYKV